MYCKYFLPVCCLPFHFLSAAFKRTENFNFDEVLYIRNFILWFVLFVSYLRIFLHILRLKRFSPRSFMLKTTLEKHMKSWFNFYEVKHTLTIQPRNSTGRYLPKRNENVHRKI